MMLVLLLLLRLLRWTSADDAGVSVITKTSTVDITSLAPTSTDDAGASVVTKTSAVDVC